ncbi:hypothetical protein ABZV64_26950 [Streptomyces sp. NPDC004959]|uniref:hypothetical protein n=1 Tax=Streptomyces sp. NPDC004959 TaxID=3154673 RepID=UPI0033A2BA38
MAPTIKQKHELVMPACDGQFGMVDSRDVSAAAAAVSASPACHEGRTYLPTGPELVTDADVAAELTRALGKEIEYRPLKPDQHREQMVRAGVPEAVAASNAQVFGLIAEGDTAWLSDGVASLTGHASAACEPSSGST